MTALKPTFACVACCAGLALGATAARAATVQDLARIKGQERNVLTGLGIVIGLNGTGDSSKDSLVAARPYAELLRNLDDPIATLDELARADAFALVSVTMEVPPTGAREGDRFDASVETLFNAKSLRGGRLVVSLLYPPLPGERRGEPLGMANGPIVVEGDNPRAGVIRGGGQVLSDTAFRTSPVTKWGTMELVLKDQFAGYPAATVLAAAINDEFVIDGHADLAHVDDAATIRVLVPEADRADPAEFIATLVTIPVDSSVIATEARIVINEKEGIITFTGNIEIGPVGITHRGLTITSITPPPVPTPDDPVFQTTQWTGMDVAGGNGRPGGSTRLSQLLAAFDQLKLPVEDQIAIIYELRKTGALHAEIVNK
jgi:flagellar P-ring protein precursor FlgI